MDLLSKRLLITGLALCGTLHLLLGVASASGEPRPLSTRDISMLATAKVPPEYVQQILHLGYSDISARDIAQLWTVRAKPEYIRSLREMDSNISIRGITQLAIVKANPEYVRQIRELGYPDISIRDITQLAVVNVTPDYIRQIRELGYPDISIRDITQLAVVNVTPDYIRSLREKEPGISIRDITQLAVVKADPEYVIKMKEFGLTSPTITISPHSKHPTHTVSESGFFSNWLTQLILGICLIIAVGGGIAYLSRSSKEPSSPPEDNIDQRLAAFEQRATDVQDILISIHNRLNRRMKLG